MSFAVVDSHQPSCCSQELQLALGFAHAPGSSDCFCATTGVVEKIFSDCHLCDGASAVGVGDFTAEAALFSDPASDSYRNKILRTVQDQEAGSVITNVEPWPGTDSTAIVPFIFATVSLTIYNPSPEPFD